MPFLNRYKEWKTKLILLYDRYFDFVLSLDDAPSIPLSGKLTEDCLSSYIDMGIDECVDGNDLLSIKEYEDAVNDGGYLYDIGFTGIDNGFVRYDKKEMTEEKFIDVLTGTTYDLTEGDKRLIMRNVTGNTGVYSYDIERKYGYFSLKGGFFQGFFKMFGYDYGVLPTHIEDEWSVEITLRPKDYEVKDNSLNGTHEGNDGLFFYMGTRSENKFAQFYNTDFSKFEKRKVVTDESNFSDEYLNSLIPTSEGRYQYLSNLIEIESDNKFLTFNRTKTGLTVNKSEGDEIVVFTGVTPTYDGNMFLDFNRTKTGLTVNKYNRTYGSVSIGPEYVKYQKPYNVTADTLNNCFALKVNEDGSVGYRYLIKDCGTEEEPNEKHYSIFEERTYPNMVFKDKWYVINVKFKMLDGSLDKCGKDNGNRKMKIYVYINGFLKLVSKELPEFNFRELNETYEKQEGVPFSMSLGGGTQGLCDSVWLDYNNPFEYILPIEENFAGSFIGDVKSFKFYTCSLQYNQIYNNYLYEMKDIKEKNL